MSATAPECSSVQPSSRDVEKVLIADTMPPTLATASAATTHSGQFGSKTATRSPRVTPAAMRARASWSTRACNAA